MAAAGLWLPTAASAGLSRACSERVNQCVGHRLCIGHRLCVRRAVHTPSMTVINSLRVQGHDVIALLLPVVAQVAAFQVANMSMQARAQNSDISA